VRRVQITTSCLFFKEPDVIVLKSMRRIFWLFILSTLPLVSYAAGLVPCGGAGEAPCQLCHFVILIKSVMGWLALVLGIAVVLMIMISGLQLVTSLGNTAVMERVKKMLSSVLIGWVLVLAAWLIVDGFLKTFTDSSNIGIWSTIQCTTQPDAIKWSRETASGDNKVVLAPSDVSGRVAAITSSGSLQTDISNAAVAAGITSSEQVDILKALISQESSNCKNKVGPATDSGTAYGCGQLLISTAKTLDANLVGLSDAAIARKLQEDNAYNLSLSAKYYKQLLTRYNNDVDLALAAYNGGPGANEPSRDCPGLRKWQCVWDSPGCYGTSNTNCQKNTGPSSYEQTRHYVVNINAIAEGL